MTSGGKNGESCAATKKCCRHPHKFSETLTTSTTQASSQSNTSYTIWHPKSFAVMSKNENQIWSRQLFLKSQHLSVSPTDAGQIIFTSVSNWYFTNVIQVVNPYILTFKAIFLYSLRPIFLPPSLYGPMRPRNDHLTFLYECHLNTQHPIISPTFTALHQNITIP